MGLLFVVALTSTPSRLEDPADDTRTGRSEDERRDKSRLLGDRRGVQDDISPPADSPLSPSWSLSHEESNVTRSSSPLIFATIDWTRTSDFRCRFGRGISSKTRLIVCFLCCTSSRRLRRCPLPSISSKTSSVPTATVSASPEVEVSIPVLFSFLDCVFGASSSTDTVGFFFVVDAFLLLFLLALGSSSALILSALQPVSPSLITCPPSNLH